MGRERGVADAQWAVDLEAASLFVPFNSFSFLRERWVGSETRMHAVSAQGPSVCPTLSKAMANGPSPKQKSLC